MVSISGLTANVSRNFRKVNPGEVALVLDRRERVVRRLPLVANDDEGADLGVRDGPLEHPEAAVGVDVANPTGAEEPIRPLDGDSRGRAGSPSVRGGFGQV